MERLIHALCALAILCVSAVAADSPVDIVTKTPGLVAFWTFGEEAGRPRLSVGTKEKHPLVEVGPTIPRVEGGPFSGYAAHFEGKQYFRVPHAELGDLNIGGKDAQVSMFAVVRMDDMSRGTTIAGIWSEGQGTHDDTGTRQYAMLLNMPTYGGPKQLTPHISSEGGVSRRADGSGLPWCADYAASRSQVPVGRWVTLGFTYDGRWIRAYFNGVLEERVIDPVKDNRTDTYFTQEGPNGGHRGMNPYFHGRGIFRYDSARHATTKIAPADFTVGARYAVGNMLGEALNGRLGGLAVFNRALTDDQMNRLHEAANLPVPVDNGDFEKGMDNWQGSGVIAADVKHGGEKSMLLDRGYVYQPPGKQRLIWIEPGYDYRVSVWIKTDGCEEQGVSVSATSHRGWLEGDDPRFIHDQGVSPALLATGGTHDWKKFEAGIPASQLTAQTKSLFIYLRHDAQKEPRGKAYFDDLMVERLPKGTILTPQEKVEKAKLTRLFPPAPAELDPHAVMQAALQLGREPSPEPLTLADNGGTTYRIYLGSDKDAIELHAAEEMSKYLGQISGASFEPFAHDGNPAPTPLLIVGRNNLLTDQLAPGIPYDQLGEDGFVIRTVGPHVVITGAQPRGTLYGVYWFLDRHLGVRWYSPDYTVVPTSKTLALKKIEEQQVPRFTFRELFSQDGDDEAYRAHNLLNGKSAHRTATRSLPGLDSWSTQWADDWHNFQRVVPDRTLHAGGQLAMMNPAVRQSAARYFTDRAGRKKRGELEYMGFSQEDRGWEPDAESRAFAKTHGGSLAAPNLDMLIGIAKAVRAKHPDAKFGGSAYQWSFPPPKNMVVPDYIQMMVAPIEADFSQPFNSPRNAAIAQSIRGWAQIAKHIVIWDYSATNFCAYIQPHPNFDAMFGNIQWLAGLPSVEGYFGQGSMTSLGAEFAHLRQWVGARMLWDPKQEWRPLVDEFVKGYYGPASPYIDQYIQLMHESKSKTHAVMSLKTPVTSPHLSFEAMRKADELFAKAERAVEGEPGFSRRVKTARMGVDAVILMRRGDYQSDALKAGVKWDPDTENRLRRLRDNSTAAGVTAYGEGAGTMADMLKTMEVDRTAAVPPAEVAGLPNSKWVEFSDLTLRLSGATIVSDPLASDGGAAKMPGNDPGWGIQLSLDYLPPQGQWKFYASVRIDPGEGPSDAHAMTLAIYPGVVRKITVAQVADGRYHTFELPGVWRSDAGRVIYFAPPGSKAIKAMYVDRVVAVQVSPQ